MRARRVNRTGLWLIYTILVKVYQLRLKCMAIKYHPEQGAIVICDFTGFVKPEMIKRRPVVVVSPRFRDRPGLCTIVPCSTTKPLKMQPYHFELNTDPPLPDPYSMSPCWVKCDMIYAVSLSRLSFPAFRKDLMGRKDV